MLVNGSRNGWGLFTFNAKEMTMKESCSREELIERAYQLGFDYEKKFRGCSQCTLAAIYDTLDFNDDKCTEVVGRATRLAVKTILDQKLLVI